jgi:hypothetical protein
MTSTGNKAVVKKLQDALDEFQADHIKWRTDNKDKNGEPDYKPPKDGSGCGCNDCITAGELLSHIY